MSETDPSQDSPPDARRRSSLEAIWGKQVAAHGYAAIPAILIRAQGRLGLSPLKFSIVVQLLEYWRDPARRPFPSKRDLAERIGITEKAIQLNMKALEDIGLIRRELRKTALGDWDTNVYHLDGLLERLRGIEPDFAKERAAKAAWREVRRNAELLPSMRKRRRKSSQK